MAIVRGNVPTPVGANNLTSLSPTKPTGLSNGDILIVELTIGSAAAITTPSGAWGSWTQFVTVNQANVVVKWGYYHIVADTTLEPASYTFTWTGAIRATGIIVAYSGVDTTTPMDVATPTTAGAGTGGTLAVGSITTVTDGAMLLSGAGQDSSGTGTCTPPGTMSAIAAAPSAGKAARLADETFATAGPTGTRTWSFSSSTLAHAVWLAALRPATSGTAVNGTATGTFTFSGTAAGTKEVFGAATAPLTFGAAAAGIPDVQGSAAAAFGFTGTAAGIPGVQGQATGSLAFTGVASGVGGIPPPVEGQALAAFTFTGVAVGIPGVVGGAAAALTFIADGLGLRAVAGQASGALTFAAEAAGTPPAPPYEGAVDYADSTPAARYTIVTRAGRNTSTAQSEPRAQASHGGRHAASTPGRSR